MTCSMRLFIGPRSMLSQNSLFHRDQSGNGSTFYLIFAGAANIDSNCMLFVLVEPKNIDEEVS